MSGSEQVSQLGGTSRTQAGDVTSTTKDEAGAVAGTVKDSASSVTSTAGQAAADVTSTVTEQAQQVAGEAARQARDLTAEVRGQVSEQATSQTQRVAQALRSLSDELAEMASKSSQQGVASEVLSQLADRGRRAAGFLDGRRPEDLLDELRSFAQRRPGTFLGGAALAGLLAGRATRTVTAARSGRGSGDGGYPGTQSPYLGSDQLAGGFGTSGGSAGYAGGYATTGGTAAGEPLAGVSQPAADPLTSPYTQPYAEQYGDKTPLYDDVLSSPYSPGAGQGDQGGGSGRQ